MNTSTLHETLYNLFINLNISDDLSEILVITTLSIGALIIAILSYYISKYLLVNTVTQLTKKTKTKWDDILVKRHFFRKLTNLVPALILLAFYPFIFKNHIVLKTVLTRITTIYTVIIVLWSIDAFISAINDIYKKSFTIAKSKPIKGYLQTLKIILFFLGGIIIISIAIGKSAVWLLSGLGALTAVLMLIFKDPILGFVGSIQLSANDMVRPGDWISMKEFGADGTVIDMNLTTVKIRNWDQTISTVPTYALVSNSFQNWRGMEEGDGRRIMRSIKINVDSIKFCSEELLDKLKANRLLTEYITKKENELLKHNKKYNIDDNTAINTRRQTNIGVFRNYLVNYLTQHPEINENMTLIVRQLEPTETGLPLQVYCFTKEKSWVKYEGIKSDIFDHILTVLPEFELSMFQNPTGNDFKQLKNN